MRLHSATSKGAQMRNADACFTGRSRCAAPQPRIHRAFARDLQHLVGGVDRTARLVAVSRLEQVGPSARSPHHMASFLKRHLVGEVVDHFVVDHGALEPDSRMRATSIPSDPIRASLRPTA